MAGTAGRGGEVRGYAVGRRGLPLFSLRLFLSLSLVFSLFSFPVAGTGHNCLAGELEGKSGPETRDSVGDEDEGVGRPALDLTLIELERRLLWPYAVLFVMCIRHTRLLWSSLVVPRITLDGEGNVSKDTMLKFKDVKLVYYICRRFVCLISEVNV